ncbi:MAG: sulfite exporter TauE/SafE family protein [Rudaea sp.]|uniref:sulfite exporter TauE/SafE family protein n=1 Tax=Rudaea sp. TaxID=2136325 RepID=UPI0039E603E7
MSGGLTLAAALLLGLAASGHCLVMCGGITAALGLATAKRADGRPRTSLLAAYQLGRIISYTLAGLLSGGVLGGFVALIDLDAVRNALRAVAAVVLLLGALVAFGRVRDPGFGVGQRLWKKLAPLGRRLLPVTSLPRALAFGMVWGWMPCGFVYTVLLIAAMRLDALDAAATMAAFGLGTAPALFAGALGAQRLAGWARLPGARRTAGFVLLAGAALTVAGPWLPGAHWLHAWLPFDCAPPTH